MNDRDAVEGGSPMHVISRKLMLAVLASLGAVGCNQFPRKDVIQTDDGSRKIAPAQAADVQYALGRSLESQGQPDKAVSAYREAAKRDPKRADAPLRLAILLDRQGRFAESAPLYAAALKASPGNPEIFCDRGYSLSLQGKDKEAEAALRQAIALKPDLARAHNNLGLLLARGGRSEDALAEFRKAGSSESDALLNLSFGLGEGHHWAEARSRLAMARAISKGSPDIEQDSERVGALIARGESMASPAKSPLATDPGLMKASAIEKRK